MIISTYEFLSILQAAGPIEEKHSESSGTEYLAVLDYRLRWYAAFHDEGHHPHIHMMVWSADGDGYLSKAGFLMRPSGRRRRLSPASWRMKLNRNKPLLFLTTAAVFDNNG